MKAQEIKQLSDSDLQEKVAEHRQALAEMKFNNSLAGLENPMQLRDYKTVIARLLTELNARKNA